MRSIILLILVVHMSVCAQAKNGTDYSANKRPNIVFILVDDLGWKDVGYMDNTYHETPNIDRLSSEGMVFTNAYANAPNCAPTRASLISGWYPPRHGIYTVGNPERGQTQDRKLIPIKNERELDSSVVTLPEVMHSAGYSTAMFGKWHLGDSPGTIPEEQGFGLTVGGGHRAGEPRTYTGSYHNSNFSDLPPGENVTDRLTTEAINFIDDHRYDPFFVYLSYYAVHTPHRGKKNLVQKYDKKSSPYERSNATYAAMLENVDRNIGMLLEKIKNTGLEENTLVVFFSDNGPYFPVTSADPLRGSKGMVYEGGIRVPMIAKWTGKIKAGSVNTEPVIGIDFFPTFLSVCSIPKPSGKILDGVDISPLFLNKKIQKSRNLYWHFPAYLEPYEGMKEKWRATPSSVIRKGDWKLIEYFEDGGLELFNLKNDVGEKMNLSKSNPLKLKELHSDLIKWRTEIKAPVPTLLNSDYKVVNKF